MISSFAQWASSQLETHEIRVQFMLGDKYLNDLQVFLLALLRRRSILWDYHGLRPSCHANIRTYNYYWWDNRIVQEWPISKAIWGTQSSYIIISASNVFFRYYSFNLSRRKCGQNNERNISIHASHFVASWKITNKYSNQAVKFTPRPTVFSHFQSYDSFSKNKW